MIVLKLLCLLLVANGMPVLARRYLGELWSSPIDAGSLFFDGKRWLGASKTWRGVFGSILGCAAVSPILGLGAGFATVFGILAMMGDLTSSFVKRRLGMPDSARATGLDQLPESLLPVLVGRYWLDYGLAQALATAALFVAFDILLSPLLHRLRIRREPY